MRRSYLVGGENDKVKTVSRVDRGEQSTDEAVTRLCDHWSDPDDGSNPSRHPDAKPFVGNVAPSFGRGDPSGETVEASRSSHADRIEEHLAAGKAVEAPDGNRLMDHVPVQDAPCAASSVMAFLQSTASQRRQDSHLSVSAFLHECPENCEEGEIMPFMLPDGWCETTRVPDGMEVGDKFTVVTSASCAGSSVEGCTPCPVDSLEGKIKASCHSHAELLIGDTIPRPIERDVFSGETVGASIHSRADTCEKNDFSGETVEASDPYCADLCGKDDLSGETVEASGSYCADPCGKDDLSGETVEASDQYCADLVAGSVESRPDGGVLETSVHPGAEKASSSLFCLCRTNPCQPTPWRVRTSW